MLVPPAYGRFGIPIVPQSVKGTNNLNSWDKRPAQKLVLNPQQHKMFPYLEFYRSKVHWQVHIWFGMSQFFGQKCAVYPHFWGQTDKLRAKPPSSKVVVSGPDLRKWSTNLTKTPNLRPATYSSESQRNRSGVRRIGQGNDLQKVEDMSIMTNCYSE